MTKRFAVVYEAAADFRTATELADRVLVEVTDDWLDEDQLPYQREWIGTVPVEQGLTWKNIKQLAGAARIRPHHGHFNGEPGFPDAAAARRAIDYLLATQPQLDAVVLIRDRDDQPDRRKGLEQARDQDTSGLPIIIGLAVVEREAWAVCGFDPQNDEETARLDAERTRLGFQPHENSHELTAGKDDTATRSPKRVLRVLSGGDFHRERRCWAETPLDRLRERGGENGLAAYLQEVRERLAPLIGHVAEG